MKHKLNADMYNQGSSIRFSAGDELLNLLEIKNGDKVLDIGSGTGKVTINILNKAPQAQITAIDISQDMVAKAQQEFADTSIQFICANFLETSFEEQFDVILSTSAFHWFSDIQDKAFLLLKKALKNGGHFGIQVPSKSFCPLLYTDVLDEIRELCSFKEYFTEFKLPWEFLSLEEYEAILENAGFTSYNITTKDSMAIFRNIEEIIRYLQACGLQPYMDKLPPALHNNFINELKLKLEAKLSNNHFNGQTINLAQNRLFITGIK